MHLSRLLRRLLPLAFLLGLGWFLWIKVRPTLLENPLNPEPRITVTHNTVLEKVEDLSRLELVKYQFKDIVEYKKSTYRFLTNAKVDIIVEKHTGVCLYLR